MFLMSAIIGGNLYAQTATSPSSRFQQSQQFPTRSMAQDLARAEQMATSFKNDSANQIAVKLLAELKELGQLDSPFGLRVQLVQAKAFEHADKDTAALKILLRLKVRCREKAVWDTYFKTCMVVGLLYESIGRGAQCIVNLKDGYAVVKQHNLDSLYPFYALRLSSYYRVSGNHLDSAAYYAKEVIRTAPRYNLISEEAWGNMLMAMMLRNKSDKEAAEYFKAATPLFIKIDDYLGHSFANQGIASIYFDEGHYKKALAYNDSTIAGMKKIIEMGHKRYSSIAGAYQFRGEIYRKLGQLDSALYYVKEGSRLELEHVRTTENERVIEIDARYNNEKKAEQIASQARELQEERARRNLLIAIIFIVLLLILALAYFYLQLQKANRKTEQQAHQLKDLDAAKSRFFANVSHELRTPLTLLLGPVRTLLKENQLTEKQNRLLQMANQSGKQLNQLVNEILDLQKLEMGKMELNQKPTGLPAFISRYVAQFESLAQRQQIDFSFETNLADDLVASIDPEKCRQILYNLLSNAFKFTPAEGRVKLTLNIGGTAPLPIHQFANSPIHRLQITVSNTGPGIHPDDLPHVFDRFFQTSRPDKPAEGGTGIGLALCHEYARLFGGNISVESTPGKGSVFSVVFPVTLADTSQLSQPEARPGAIEMVVSPQVSPSARPVNEPANSTSKPAILVVEDNPELQDYIRLILEEKYHVVTAGNGQEALSVLNGELKMENGEWGRPRDISILHSPFLILSDLMMPVMDGYQLLEKLKSDDATRHIPVIMLTARAEAQDRLKALRIGVDDYLTKPFDEEELLARIENLLVNYRNRQAAPEQKPDLQLPPAETEEVDLALSASDQKWLEQFETYLLKNLSSDILSVSLLAQQFAMSESTLLRQLKRLTGLTPVQYIQEIRLDKARHLLENRTYDSIAKVASEVGYIDPRSFSRLFNKRFGKLPSDFISG